MTRSRPRRRRGRGRGCHFGADRRPTATGPRFPPRPRTARRLAENLL